MCGILCRSRLPLILAALVGAVVVRTPIAAAQAVSPDKESNAPVLKRISSMGAEMAKLGDWDDQYALIQDSIDRLWEENNWSEESDLFAQQLVHELAAIPPWEFSRRMERLSDAVGDRYAFTKEQSADFESRMYGLLGSMVMRGGGKIIRHTREMVAARLRNEPFTPEQVARWTTESDDLLENARQQFDQMAAEMAQSMTPEQKELFRRDMESYARRMETVDGIRERWRRGEWRPDDWGLQNDPLYRNENATAAGAAASATDTERHQIPSYSAVDETTWERYVREFIERYALNDAQADAALSILKELESRAADYRKLYADELAAVQPEEREKAGVYQPIQRLFEELQRRLSPIPTEAQERNAAKGTP